MLLAILFSGWTAVPVRLVQPEAVTCGMVCCEDNGACCCFEMRSAARLGLNSDGDHDHVEVSGAGEGASSPTGPETGMVAAAIDSGCPPQCANIPSISTVASAGTGAIHYTRTIDVAPTISSRAPHFARDALGEQARHPRPPPTSLL